MLFILIIFLFLAVAFLEITTDLLNTASAHTELPSEFQGFYDSQKYKTAQEYLKDRSSLAISETLLMVVITIGFMWWGGFNAVDQFARNFGFSAVITSLIFVGTLAFINWIIGLPFTLYETFIIEEKYEFNKTTFGTFCLDTIKATVLGILIGAPVFSGIVYFFEHVGPWAWFYSWVTLTIVQLVFSFLAPAFILPLFNKFIPLPEGELKQAIENYARSQNFILKGIFTMDASKRSTKANAFFTGFGKFRRIVLFDTLIKNHQTEELVAVLAHEIGHFKKKHIIKSTLLSILSSGILFFIISFFINSEPLFQAFKMEHVSTYASIVFIAFIFSPILKLSSILTHHLSRKHEFEADAFATKTYGKPETLIVALKKLSVDNLSNLTPHPLKVWMDYTHPPILKRIDAIRHDSISQRR